MDVLYEPQYTDVHTVGPKKTFFFMRRSFIKRVSTEKGLHLLNYCSLVHTEYEQGKQNLQCSRLYKENGRDIYVA